MKEFCLKNIIRIKHGFAFDGEYISQDDNGIVLVTPGNFKIGGGFQEDKCKFYTGEIPSEYILNPGSYIVTMTDLSKNIDTLGYSAIVPDTQRVYLHNQRIGLIEFINESFDKKYIYYLLQTHQYQRTIANTSTGATVHHTSPSKICDYKFFAPDIKTQKKIADILSAYDDLIENNQKQIKLLEEAAQRLYKEWFVDLHFPGYEHTKIVDGVPEGWKIQSVSEFGKVITGKTPSTSKPEYYGGNIPFVTIPDMHNTVFPLSTEKYLSQEGANTQKNKFLPPNSVMISCIATVGLVNITSEQCQTNQQINSVILKNEKDLYFFYFAMKCIKSLLDGVGSNGATMTNVNKAKFASINILYPKSNLINYFFEFSDPIFRKILILSKESRRLQQARDRLLPKLMSGEVEV